MNVLPNPTPMRRVIILVDIYNVNYLMKARNLGFLVKVIKRRRPDF